MKLYCTSNPKHNNLPSNIKVNFDNISELYFRDTYPESAEFYDELLSLLPSALSDINGQGNDLKALVDVWLATGHGILIDVVVYGFDIHDYFDPYLDLLSRTEHDGYLQKLDNCVDSYFVSLLDAKYRFGNKTIKTGPYQYCRYEV